MAAACAVESHLVRSRRPTRIDSGRRGGLRPLAGTPVITHDSQAVQPIPCAVTSASVTEVGHVASRRFQCCRRRDGRAACRLRESEWLLAGRSARRSVCAKGPAHVFITAENVAGSDRVDTSVSKPGRGFRSVARRPVSRARRTRLQRHGGLSVRGGAPGFGTVASAWVVADPSQLVNRDATLIDGRVSLHAVRLSDRTWAVDEGNRCV